MAKLGKGLPPLPALTVTACESLMFTVPEVATVKFGVVTKIGVPGLPNGVEDALKVIDVVPVTVPRLEIVPAGVSATTAPLTALPPRLILKPPVVARASAPPDESALPTFRLAAFVDMLKLENCTSAVVKLTPLPLVLESAM